MKTKYTYEELIAKLVRATLLAKKLEPDKRHTAPCPQIDDDSFRDCICGTDEARGNYRALLEELKI